MPARFVGVNSTFDEQRLAINDLAIDLFALQNETAVDYARVAGVATYAEYAGFSTYTPLAGVSTYSSISGYSTTSGYAGAAGIATNATFSVQAGYAITAGVSTEAGYATAAGFADTSTYGTYAYYSQIAGFATAAQDSQTANLAASIRVTAQNTGTNYLTFVNVLGNGSYQNVWTDSELKYEPATNSFYAGIISATSISGDGSGLFNVSSEVVGVSTAGTSGFNNLNIAGVSTFSGGIGVGTDTSSADITLLASGGNFPTSDPKFHATQSDGSGIAYAMYVHDGRGTGIGDTGAIDQRYVKQVVPSGHWSVGVSGDKSIIFGNNDGFTRLGETGWNDSDIALKINPNTSTELRYNYDKKFETTGAGVSVTGDLNVSGISSFTGNVSFGSTATFGSNDEILLGDSQELSLKYSSSSSAAIISAGGNPVDIKGTAIRLKSNLDENIIIGTTNDSVSLYYDNAKKFETTGAGVTVTGTVYADDFSTAGIATANEFRLNTWGVTSYTRMSGGEVLASGVNDKGLVQVGALTTCFGMGHAPFNSNCYFSQTGENDWVFWSSLTTTSMTVNGGISTRPHSVTVRELYVDTNANVAGVTTFQGETNFDGNINSPINVVGVNTSTFAGDVGVGTDQSSGVVLTSPNGTKYRLVVDNIGNLSTVAV